MMFDWQKQPSAVANPQKNASAIFCFFWTGFLFWFSHWEERDGTKVSGLIRLSPDHGKPSFLVGWRRPDQPGSADARPLDGVRWTSGSDRVSSVSRGNVMWWKEMMRKKRKKRNVKLKISHNIMTVRWREKTLFMSLSKHLSVSGLYISSKWTICLQSWN